MTGHPTIGNRQLLSTCWTSAGNAAPDRGDEVSPVDLRTRIETAAEVGWEGFGLLHADLAVARDTMGLPELRRVLDGAGIESVRTGAPVAVPVSDALGVALVVDACYRSEQARGADTPLAEPA